MNCAALLLFVVAAQGTEEAPKDEYLYLTSKFDTDGFASREKPEEGDFDGKGESFLADGFPEGRRLTVRSARFGPVLFLRPPTDEAKKNFLACRGQTIAVRTKNVFNVLLCLGAAHSGSPDGWIEFGFEDGVTAKGAFGLTDWKGEPVFGEEEALALHAVKKDARPGIRLTRTAVGGRVTSVRSVTSGSLSTTSASIWLQQIPIPRPRRIVSIKLPELPNARVLALTLAQRDGVVKLASNPRPGPVEKAPVAVLAEPGFPYFLGLSELGPEALRDELGKFGVRVAFLSARDLADSSVLTPENFPVFVHPYGNTFPEAAADAIRQYRKSGGAMAHCGVPFTHPARRTPYGVWVDRGHTAGYMTHDGPLAMGSGGFRNVGSVAPVPFDDALDSWKLGGLPWTKFRLGSSFQAPPQSLATASLAESDEVMPLLGVQGAKDSLVAAVIRHKSCGFSGCIDVWTGVPGFYFESDRIPTTLRRRIFLRGVFWLLREKGILEESAWNTVAQPLTEESIAVKAPEPVFPGAEDKGELPPLPPPGKRVYYLELTPGRVDVTTSERVLLSSAQGLINRADEKSLYVVNVPRDLTSLRRVREAVGVEELSKVTFAEVFDLVGHRRAVVVDPDLYGSLNLATMIAAVEGILVAYPGDVGTHGLEAVADLRGLFGSGPEMLGWAYQNLWPRMPRDALCMYPPVPEAHTLRDYIIAQKIFTFWIPVWTERSARGIFPPRERAIAERILSEAPVGTPVLGMLGDGSTVGPGTGPGLEILSRYGKPFEVMDAVANLTFFAKLKGRSELHRESEAREQKVESDKIYVACLQPVAPRTVFQARSGSRSTRSSALRIRRPSDGQTVLAPPAPTRVGYSMSSPLLDIVPAQAKLYLEGAEGATLGSNGAGQFNARAFGVGFGSARRSVLSAYLQTTWHRMAMRGQSFLHVSPGFSLRHELDGEVLESGSSKAGIFVAVSSTMNPTPNALTAHYLVGDVPVFHDIGSAQLQALIKEKSEGKLSPRLLPTFVWTTPSIVRRLQTDESFNEHVVVVRPDELALLYRKWRSRRDLLEEVLVAEGSLWRYNDQGRDLGGGWRIPDYDDSGWKEGEAELGYGDAASGSPEKTVLSFGGDAEKKHPTYYFRRAFEFPAGLELDLLVLDVIADDGCVVYLNGTERFRHNLPEGDVSYATLSRSAVGGSAEHRWNSQVLKPFVLSRGKNTVAVEVHQANATSTDVSFDLRLRGYRWKLR